MPRNNVDYGVCSKCGANLEPVFFTEEETKTANGIMYKTGRIRHAVSHLECPNCLTKACVDDTFDGPWYHK